jgi:thiamine pyrophosphate-dependent acetolactate synthase large subunit-like protein
MKRLEAVEAPAAITDARANSMWASDVMAELIRRMGIKFLAVTPGASYRGLHDSVVNLLGNTDPKLILCIHEEHAVSLAQGYAKVTGEPMGAVLHANVGLLHGSMSIFNAFIDRVPMIVFGATGPVDAAKRRPWIEWIHTHKDQGGLVRPFTKWDDQPVSIGAAIESIVRANQISRTAPQGPTYVCLDQALQEEELLERPELPDIKRFQPPLAAVPAPGAIQAALGLLTSARRPLLLAGRVSRDELQWRRRVALAEALNCKVITDFKNAAAFPTDHPLHIGEPAFTLTKAATGAFKEADVVMSLDWVDLGGTLKTVFGKDAVKPMIIQASIDHTLHSGWSMEYQQLPPVDLHLAADPDATVSVLCQALGISDESLPKMATPGAVPLLTRASADMTMDITGFGAALGEALAGENICFVRLPQGWDGALWHFRHPLDYLGIDGGCGLGSGPGMSVGSALALRGSGRVAVSVIGDGDFVMASSALWTATHYGLPLLMVVCNNTSFYNDEIHQERMAKTRTRPTDNKWIGMRLSDPEIDLAGLARAQGAEGIGPVTSAVDLAQAVKDGLQHVKAGKVCVVDARVVESHKPRSATASEQTGG